MWPEVQRVARGNQWFQVLARNSLQVVDVDRFSQLLSRSERTNPFSECAQQPHGLMSLTVFDFFMRSNRLSIVLHELLLRLGYD